ncbi:hypothetical protein BURMUCF2_2274, partial [Burkholderia multivorans CF2]
MSATAAQEPLKSDGASAGDTGVTVAGADVVPALDD